jgi:hypothetical protein
VVASTSNAISGDAIHGFDPSPGKFSRDIFGNTRVLWSMGACEFAPDLPPAPPTGLRVVAGP